MATVGFMDPDMKLTNNEATKIKMELRDVLFEAKASERLAAIWDAVLQWLAVLMPSTEVWLEKKVGELAHIIAAQLKLGHAHVLVKMV